METERPSYQEFYATLTSLRNPRGYKIIWRQDDVDELWKMGAPLDDLQRLFKFTDDQGNEKFFASTVWLLANRKGYTTSDFFRINALKDSKGREMLVSSNELFHLLEIEEKVTDEIVEISGIQDSEGRTIFRHDRDIMGQFDGVDSIIDAIKCGLNSTQIKEITSLVDKKGKTVFKTPRDIIRFLESKGTVKYAKDVLLFTDHKGHQIFNEFTIGLLKEYGTTVDDIKEIISIKDTEGQTVFSGGEEVVDFFRDSDSKGRNLMLLNNLMSLRDSSNRSVFRDGRDILTVLRTKKGVELAKKFLQIKSSDGKTYFRGDEISMLLKYKIPVEYATKMAKVGLNALTTMYYFRIGLNEKQTEFNSSDKPKALMLYPSSDPRGMLDDYAFRDDESIDIIKKVEKGYNLKLRVISSVDEMFAEIEKSGEVELLWIGGHGSGTSITFGEDNLKYGIKLDKHQMALTVDTKEVGKRLKKLRKLKTILLDSCFAGKGGFSEKNMVNFISDLAPGVLVIGPKKPTNARKTEILKLNPLDVSFRATYSGEECTHKARR